MLRISYFFPLSSLTCIVITLTRHPIRLGFPFCVATLSKLSVSWQPPPYTILDTIQFLDGPKPGNLSETLTTSYRY